MLIILVECLIQNAELKRVVQYNNVARGGEMSKQSDFKNRDRLIQLGIVIAALRKMRGLSQEQLAEKANISRSFLSSIEAPGIVRPFSLEVFYNIADALEIEPADLLKASMFPDQVKSDPKNS